MAKQFNSALYGVAVPIRAALFALPQEIKEKVFEIRLRIGQPVVLTTSDAFLYLCENGYSHILPAYPIIADSGIIADSFDLICDFSQHTHAHELAQGFVSMRSGHRAGIGGTAVIRDGTVVSMRDISSINIRIARQVKNVAKGVLGEIFSLFGGLKSFIYFGPPGCGKTTYLRDTARILSSDYGLRCVLIDERMELGADFDLGAHCDILRGCTKVSGIEMAVRSLNPQVILFDEIGSEREAGAVTHGITCGVRMITTAHADSIDVLKKRKIMRGIFDTGEVRRAVFLEKVGAPARLEELL